MAGQWHVTGANGYLGGALCQGLAAKGFSVVALARAGRPLEALERVGVACHAYDALPELLGPGDVFVHCAGKVCSTGQWADYEQINIEWTVSLFDEAERKGAACFIYISSVAALGYSNRSDGVLDESSEPCLLEGELYGRSKLLAEQALEARSREAKTRLVILRPGLVYGRRVVQASTHWLRRGSIVDPHQRVPLVHVDSVLSAVVKTGETAAASGVYMLVDDEQPTLWEWNALKRRHGQQRYQPWPLGKTGFRALCLIRALIRKLRGQGAPPQGYVEAQYAMHTRRLRYSTDKLKTATGWVPVVTLEAGMEDPDPRDVAETAAY